jgi:hypothetical protein
VFLAVSAIPIVPWMVRNHLLYGNFLASPVELLRHFVSVRAAPLGLIQFFTESSRDSVGAISRYSANLQFLRTHPSTRCSMYFSLFAGPQGLQD